MQSLRYHTLTLEQVSSGVFRLYLRIIIRNTITSIKALFSTKK